MEKNNIEAIVKEILVDTLPELKHKAYDQDKKQDQFESWDSFSHIELIGRIEERFGIQLDITEVVGLDTPRKIIEAVKSKLFTK